MNSVFKFTIAVGTSAVLFACAPSHHATTDVAIPVQTAETQSATYLSGDDFCATYKDITSQEFAMRVKVPFDYADASKGTITLYAYTMAKFDPKKPSYVYVDGGPGQNTHGQMPELFGGTMNEIRFDQRGLGCSSPATYAMYTDPTLYSTENTVRDLEAIREAYHTAKWSVYGISYGTVVATMYGSRYAASTKAVVLEGVVGDLTKLNIDAYRAQKLNLIVATLNPAQRATLLQLMTEDSDDRSSLVDMLINFFQLNRGMVIAEAVLKKVITADGVLHRDVLHRGIARQNQTAYENPQQPGAVDNEVLTVIYCKDLGQGQIPQLNLGYRDGEGFYTFAANTADADSSLNACKKVGVNQPNRKVYDPADYKTSRPVYYFQGSHDGSTQASGAIAHWKIVPQKDSYFLLANKGGHNPNLLDIGSPDRDLRDAELALFKKAVMAQKITKADVENVNQFIVPEQTWVLYLARPTTPLQEVNLDAKLEGLKLVTPLRLSR